MREGKGKYWIKDKKYDKRDESSGRLITGVWENDVMKSGVVNEQIRLDESLNEKLSDNYSWQSERESATHNNGWGVKE